MPQYGTPTRFNSGLSTVKPGWFMASYPRPSPINLQFQEEDFFDYDAGSWLVTAATGSVTIQPGAGGHVLLATTAANNDIVGLQNQAAVWAVQNGGGMWFSTNVNVNDATAAQFQFGFADTFVALTPTQGIYFDKPNGATLLNLVIKGAGGTTTLPIGNIVAATQYSFGFFYDGKGSPSIYVASTINQAAPVTYSQPYYAGGVIVAAASNDAINNPNAQPFSQPSVNLVMGIAVKAGAVAIKNVLVDYLIGGCEIPTRV